MSDTSIPSGFKWWNIMLSTILAGSSPILAKLWNRRWNSKIKTVGSDREICGTTLLFTAIFFGVLFVLNMFRYSRLWFSGLAAALTSAVLYYFLTNDEVMKIYKWIGINVCSKLDSDPWPTSVIVAAIYFVFRTVFMASKVCQLDLKGVRL